MYIFGQGLFLSLLILIKLATEICGYILFVSQLFKFELRDKTRLISD